MHPKTFRIRDFGELPLILPNGAHANRRLVDNAALEHGVRLRVQIEADSVAFAKAMVERGLGYTILTSAAVHEEVSRGQLIAYPIVRPHLSTHVCIVTPRGQVPKLTQDAAEMLGDVCRALVRNRRWAGARLD